MLDARPDDEALDTADVRRREPATEQRVFGVGLEQPTTEGGSMQIDRRTEHDINVLATPLAGQQLAHLLGGGLVPGLSQQRRVGEQRHLGPARELTAPDTGRAVAEDHLAQADGILTAQGEHRTSGQQADLGLEVEVAGGLRDHLIDAGGRGVLAHRCSSRPMSVHGHATGPKRCEPRGPHGLDSARFKAATGCGAAW